MLKRISSVLISAFLIFALMVVVTTKQAHAYIDIASGGLLIQVLVAAGISSLLTIKIFWQRLFSGASRLLSKKNRSEPEIK